ncbi:hypothetical protein F4677DRAFT_453256 [Hypoxylon crocopeplum]|nr:hypothetical protein F4677DRAFT_453256 [Hypoxylon crocopeplum]
MESALNQLDSERMVVPGNMTTICHSLCTLLGEQKVASLGSPAYNESVASYFSGQQEALRPACIVSPQTTEDVSATIRILTSCPDGPGNFAIRSGGHANWAGASNIAGGVVIDIRALNAVHVHSDKSTVSVGADPIGLSVNDGRAAGVGVGGLTLGGGISYFSPRYGWTCDAVTSFEIVLADASVVEVNANSDQELFQALKGGNNNFGVVTRIDFATFTQGLIWAGNVYHNPSIVDDVISELVKISSADAYDEYASIITTFGYSQALGIAVVSSALEYTKEVKSPPIYQDLLALPNLVFTAQLVNMRVLAKVTQAYSPNHTRSINRVRTLVLSIAAIKAAYVQWEAGLPSIRDVSNIVWALALEPLPPKIYARHANENALGLADRSGSLVVALLTVTWTEASDDEAVNDAAKKLMDAIEREAQQLGDLDSFIYLNYADKDQDPIGSYGAASVSRLRAVQERVDPRQEAYVHVVCTYLLGGGLNGIPRMI